MYAALAPTFLGMELTAYNVVGNSTYLALGLVALWGAYCVAVVWMRAASKRFRREAEQEQFLDEVDAALRKQDFGAVGELCAGDPRAVPQLVALALEHRELPFDKIQERVLDRLESDVLADLDYRMTWVGTVIKSAPMLGLFGTVLGMMGAFGELAAAETVKAEDLANDIQLALITTALGLAIAIPLVIVSASLSVRLRRLEEQAAFGLARFFETYRTALSLTPITEEPPRAKPAAFK